MTDVPNNKSHELRGHMVTRKTENEIAALAVGSFISIHQSLDGVLDAERMIDYFGTVGISIHIMSNKGWDKKHTRFKKGESIPSLHQITIPERLIKGTKKNNSDDWHTFFHEIGHVLLEHKPIYLKADDDYIVQSMDDAEEQADYYARIMMQLFDIKPKLEQLQFNF